MPCFIQQRPQTIGLASTITIDRVTTEHQGNGANDYIAWQKLVAMTGGSSIDGASIPEPAAPLLAITVLVLLPTRRPSLAV